MQTISSYASRFIYDFWLDFTGNEKQFYSVFFEFWIVVIEFKLKHFLFFQYVCVLCRHAFVWCPFLNGPSNGMFFTGNCIFRSFHSPVVSVEFIAVFGYLLNHRQLLLLHYVEKVIVFASCCFYFASSSSSTIRIISTVKHFFGTYPMEKVAQVYLVLTNAINLIDLFKK